MNLSSPLASVLRDSDAAILTALERTTDGFTGRRLEALTAAKSRSAHLNALRRLEDLGLIHRTEVGNASLFTLNRRHVLWRPLSIILASADNVEEGIRRMVVARLPEATVATFGSFARGEAGVDSDLDLVIVADGGEGRRRTDLLDDLTEWIQLRTGNPAHVLLLDSSELVGLVRAQDPLVASWLDDARTLAGTELRTLIRIAAAA